MHFCKTAIHFSYDAIIKRAKTDRLVGFTEKRDVACALENLWNIPAEFIGIRKTQCKKKLKY